MKRKLICPYCGAPVIYAPGQQSLRKEYPPKGRSSVSLFPLAGLRRLCIRAPARRQPDGHSRQRRLRRKRVKAHDALNPLRQTKHMDKWASYLWLQCKLGLDAEHTHIGAFTEPMCNRVIALCAQEQAAAG